MSSHNVVSDPEVFSLQFERISSQMRCSLPGVIIGFNPADQTATVQPAIKMKVGRGDDLSQNDLPAVQNVPVVLPFAQNAGLLLTIPIQAGDECLLVFSDRAIDNFMQSGGMQPAYNSNGKTTVPRTHRVSDAICIPGIVSNPQAVTKYNTNNIELRDRERSHFISLGPEGIEISNGVASWKMSGGSASLKSSTE